MLLTRFVRGAAMIAAASVAVIGLGVSGAQAAAPTTWNDANGNGQIDKPDTGQAVRCAQRAVIFDGISVGSSGADGDFGTNTKNGVIAYQGRYSLGRDGMVGVNTGGRMVTQVRAYQRLAHQTGESSAPFDSWIADCFNRYNNNSGQSIFHG